MTNGSVVFIAVFNAKLPTTLTFSGFAYAREYFKSEIELGSGNGMVVLDSFRKVRCASIAYNLHQSKPLTLLHDRNTGRGSREGSSSMTDFNLRSTFSTATVCFSYLGSTAERSSLTCI
jgi:hypothetical protein